MNKTVRGFATAILLVAAFVPFASSANARRVPEQLHPPSTETLLLQLHARGDQIYSCKADGAQFNWGLKAPDARLFDTDGKPFGRHFAGPTWEANDGSRVTGKVVGNVPSPDADSIPWLLVTVIDRAGQGVLARVTSIQRLNTKRGKPVPSGCDSAHVGKELRVPYSADYLFFAPK